METTSWPLNYPKSDEWPPRPQMPSVNAHSQYPGIENLVRVKRDGPYGGRSHAQKSYIERVQNEFTDNLGPELRKLWATVYRDDVVFGPPESLNKMIEYCLEKFQSQIMSIIKNDWNINDWTDERHNTVESKIKLSQQLVMAQYLADHEVSLIYEELIDSIYPNPPFLIDYAVTSPFSRYVLGKYPLVLFQDLDLSEDWMVDFELESVNVVAHPYDEAMRLARNNYEESIGYLSSNWLSIQTGLPTIVFSTLQDITEYGPRALAIRALVNSTCGFERLVENAVEEDGWGHCLGFEGKGQEYQFFNRSWVVGIEE
mgnify:CR=1 FL=1|tara:strand:+ start:581 stop:1522 length:942 start_codon:yes stop_codon:yes gene_type:complete